MHEVDLCGGDERRGAEPARVVGREGGVRAAGLQERALGHDVGVVVTPDHGGLDVVRAEHRTGLTDEECHCLFYLLHTFYLHGGGTSTRTSTSSLLPP